MSRTTGYVQAIEFEGYYLSSRQSQASSHNRSPSGVATVAVWDVFQARY